jgi:beta-N-acetylhexosaminidase
MDEMRQVAANAKLLAGTSLRRAEAALAARRKPDTLDIAAARSEFARMIGRAQTVARA